MKYKDRFISAVNKTQELGLNVSLYPLPFKKEMSHKKIHDVIRHCFWNLHSKGIFYASQVAAKCTLISLELQNALRIAGVKSYITIGDVVFAEQDYIYCEMSYESIGGELKNPNVYSPLKAHVWLTLEDGTIIDFTAMAHIDLMCGDPDFELSSSKVVVARPGVESKSNYYRPYLVDVDFLIKTGTIG